MIKNIKLTFAYDGSKFSGLQTQKDKYTVQGAIEKAIYKVTNKKSRLILAGRTDAGVHAYGQVANFLCAADIPASAYLYKLRPYLPQAISIIGSEEVDLDFHSRFSAKKKTYRYIIYNDDFMHPCYNSLYCHVRYRLNIDHMKEAARLLCGKHDFKAFSKYEKKNLNTIRVIDSINIEKKDKLVIIEFCGESFLYNQIRIMVGALVDVGRGHRKPSYISEIIQSKDRLKAGITYGPQGLYLMKITY